MLRTFFIAAAAMLLGLQAHAKVNQMPTAPYEVAITNAVTHEMVQPMMSQMIMSGIFTVGDSADYNMNMGFITGTTHMFVRQQTSQGFWVETDINASLLGQQKVEALYSPAGKLLKLLVNGKPQTPPDPSTEKVVTMHKATVTVPKGTFVCMYIKIEDTSNNQDSEIWVNRSVPIGGMVKEVSPSQIGNVTLELTNFSKN